MWEPSHGFKEINRLTPLRHLQDRQGIWGGGQRVGSSCNHSLFLLLLGLVAKSLDYLELQDAQHTGEEVEVI